MRISTFPKCWIEELVSGSMNLMDWIETSTMLACEGLELMTEQEACRAVVKRTGARYKPGSQNRALYEDLFQAYRSLYRQTKQLF